MYAFHNYWFVTANNKLNDWSSGCSESNVITQLMLNCRGSDCFAICSIHGSYMHTLTIWLLTRGRKNTLTNWRCCFCTLRSRFTFCFNRFHWAWTDATGSSIKTSAIIVTVLSDRASVAAFFLRCLMSAFYGIICLWSYKELVILYLSYSVSLEGSEKVNWWL